MQRYSALALLRNALSGHQNWQPQWQSPEPKASYDAVIIGAGGHGLGTAYYLAKDHGLTNIAVVEKGWLGGGNTGRNTTIIRSNYLWEESEAIYEHSVKLWKGLSDDLNYNVMYSPRGVIMLAHTVHDIQVFKRHVHANRLAGIDNEWLTPEQAKAFCPPLNISPSLRYPVLGAALQRRGGTARHDAVAWGYARAASARGVDIIQNCEVTAIRRDRVRCGGCCRDDAWNHSHAQSRRCRRRPHICLDGHGGCAHADRKLPATSAGLRAGQAGSPVRRDVKYCACLYLAV